MRGLRQVNIKWNVRAVNLVNLLMKQCIINFMCFMEMKGGSNDESVIYPYT